ncbi:MAG: hypothetical protein FWF15_04225 [Oscillospiraceae bacterium]|nr:hypothetical protein [Oscillospiraceae bacterium]
MKKIILILIILILSASLSISAQEINWKTPLENLLVQFPTTLDETVKSEVGNGIVQAIDAEGIYFPGKYRFQDLDGDGIPEVMITFGIPQSEWVFERVFKLYGDSYEQIGQDMYIFYQNAQGKLVAATISGYRIGAIYFAEIENKKLILKDYIDSNGNDNFNGVKYNNLSELKGIDIWCATDADDTLQLLPEIDCSDIVSTARSRVYDNPQTGDNNLLAVFAILIIFIIFSQKILKTKKGRFYICKNY